MRRGFFLLGLILGACSSAPPRASLDSPFHLVFSTHRYLELEPCGCTLAQLGGVDREANALRSYRDRADGPLLTLSAGSSFVPYEDPKGGTPRFLRLKRDTLLEAMNSLGVQALAPSGEDASLGAEELQRLAAAAKFPFVSANLVDKTHKPLFATHHWFTEKGKNILVIGLASPASARFPLASNVRWLPPRVALQEVFSKLDRRPDRVIALAPLANLEIQRLAAEFPQIHYFLGGPPVDAASEFAGHPTPSSMRTTAVARGRGMSWVRSELEKPMTKFFGPALKEGQEAYEAVLKERVALLEAKKGSDYEAAKKELETFREFPSEPSPNWVTYEAGDIRFGPQFAEPANALTDIVKAFRTNTRRLAVDGD